MNNTNNSENRTYTNIYFQGYIKRLLNCLFPVLTLCALYCFFVPISTIQDNQRFLSVTPELVWFKLFLITLGTTLVISLTVALFQKTAGMIVVSLLTGIILASFAQMLFLNSELGVLNGTYPSWRENIGKIVLNAVIWIALIFIPVIVSLTKKGYHSIFVMAISLAVFTSQIVSIGVIALSGKTDSLNELNYVLNGRDQYTVSSKKNILVFSLDRLSKDNFETILEKDQEIKNGLKDFTYYSNTCGTYATTFPSLVGVLTGTEYLGDISYKDYFSDSWNSEFVKTLYPTLHNNNYKVNLFIDEYLCNEGIDLLGKVDNIIPANKEVKNLFYPRILRMSFYKLLPFFLKEYALVSRSGTVMTTDFLNKAVSFSPAIENNNGYEPIRRDITFYYDLINRELDVDDDNSIFLWTHLHGAHSPYYIDSRANYVRESTATEQATGYLFALETYFDKLKKLGIYDDSTIIITSDHGVEPSSNKPYSLFIPLMIKLPGETHTSVSVNNSPLSLIDLAPTFLSLVDDNCENNAKTVFDYAENDIRQRIFRRFNFLPEYDMNGWTKGRSGEFNVLETYRFTGEQDNLNQMIDAKNYEVTELVDSFY